MEKNSVRSDLLFEKPIETCLPKEWMTTEEAAEYLGVSPGTLRNLTSNGTVPYYKFGRRNRYRLEELRLLLLSKRKGAINGI